MRQSQAMHRKTTLVVVAGVLVGLLGGSADAKTKSFKAKPSGAKCIAKHIDEPSAVLRCSIPGKRGKAVILTRNDKAKVKSASVKVRHAPVLGSGQENAFGPFSCKSGEALSCRSNAGHGFGISESFQLLF